MLPLALDIAIGVVLKDGLGISSELIAEARRCVDKHVTHDLSSDHKAKLF